MRFAATHANLRIRFVVGVSSFELHIEPTLGFVVLGVRIELAFYVPLLADFGDEVVYELGREFLASDCRFSQMPSQLRLIPQASSLSLVHITPDIK